MFLLLLASLWSPMTAAVVSTEPAQSPTCPESCCSSSGLFQIQEDKCILTKSAQKLTADVMKEMGNSDENVFISPFSVTNILQLLLLASEGETKTELSDSLATQSIDIHGAAKCISDEIVKLSDRSLNYTNDFFISHDYKGDFGAYKELAQYYYTSSFYSCRFRDRPERARGRVNHIVATKSRGLIPELFQRGSISNETKLIIVNTVTFKSEWQNQFDKRLSALGKFHVSPNLKIQTTFMRVQANFTHEWMQIGTDSEDSPIEVTVLDMPYTSAQYNLLAFKFSKRLHRYRDLAEIEAYVAEHGILAIQAKLRLAPLEVNFPRFKMAYERELNEIFTPATSLGAVFSPRADYSNFADGLHISNIIHKAAVEITEEGTVASGSSGGSFAQRDITIMSYDSPFVFYIYHACDGLVLFQGRLVNPADS